MKKGIVLLLNIFIFINTLLISIIDIIFGASAGQVGSNIKGISYFRPYTIDSNILMAVASLILIISIIKNKKISSFSYKFYYISTVSIILTFLTVVLFLTPTLYMSGGYKIALSLYSKDMAFFHVLNPLFAFITFNMIPKQKLTIKDNLLSLIPMVLYSILYCLNVLVFKRWEDFYGFTFGGKNNVIPFVIITIYLITYLIGLFVRKQSRK